MIWDVVRNRSEGGDKGEERTRSTVIGRGRKGKRSRVSEEEKGEREEEDNMKVEIRMYLTYKGKRTAEK